MRREWKRGEKCDSADLGGLFHFNLEAYKAVS